MYASAPVSGLPVVLVVLLALIGLAALRGKQLRNAKTCIQASIGRGIRNRNCHAFALLVALPPIPTPCIRLPFHSVDCGAARYGGVPRRTRPLAPSMDWGLLRDSHHLRSPALFSNHVGWSVQEAIASLDFDLLLVLGPSTRARDENLTFLRVLTLHPSAGPST